MPKIERDKHKSKFNQQIRTFRHMQQDMENPRLPDHSYDDMKSKGKVGSKVLRGTGAGKGNVCFLWQLCVN